MRTLLAVTILFVAAAAAQAPRVAVISYRGERLHHPENTIPAFQEAIQVGADFFELDVRTTSDGQLVLMRDATVDRTTNGHGEVSKMTFVEIRTVDAGIKMGPEFTGTRVPTFDEALDLARGKIGIYVDVKNASAKDLVEHINRHAMTGHVVIHSGRISKTIQDLGPRLRIMPEARNATFAQELIDTLHPKVLAFDASDFKPEVMAVAKKSNVLIYVDRLGPDDNPEVWEQAIDSGAHGIQTDHPEQLVKFLRR